MKPTIIGVAVAIFLQITANAQSDTLVQVDKAHRLHRSGIAGQVLLVPELLPGQQTAPYQTTLSIYVERFNHTRKIGQVATAADGTFFLNLPPGTYVIAPVLPQIGLGFNSGLSSVPVTVTVKARQITPVEVDVIKTGGVIGF